MAAILVARELREGEALAIRQRDALAVAAANLGEAELWVEPFDLGAGGQMTPVAVAEVPELTVSLHRAAVGSAWTPGPPLAIGEHEILAVSSTVGARLALRLEAPGITAFVRIDGRGRAGDEPRPPSWIRIQSLPGYLERQQGVRTVYRLAVPTCRASGADMVEIPAGEFGMARGSTVRAWGGLRGPRRRGRSPR